MYNKTWSASSSVSSSSAPGLTCKLTWLLSEYTTVASSDKKEIKLNMYLHSKMSKNLQHFLSANISCRKYSMVMVFNATSNNISVISWQSFLLVEETRASRENHGPVTSQENAVIDALCERTICTLYNHN